MLNIKIISSTVNIKCILIVIMQLFATSVPLFATQIQFKTENWFGI